MAFAEPLCRIRDIYRCINDFEIEFYARYGVKLNEAMLLCSLSKSGESASGQIAEMLGLSLSNASKVIIASEEKGLVERNVGREDKRQMFFRLTDEGKKRISEIHRYEDEIVKLIEEIQKI
jgi:DNA-binding MarR family transcriptional regulator